MKRTHLNLSIDVLAFAAFLFLASTGVLLGYRLPPGSGDRIGRGGGFGSVHHEVATLWGWTRHEWGNLHFWIACGLLAILAFHIFLHWNWIVCVVRGKSRDRSGLRLTLGACALAILMLLSLAPLIGPVVHQTRPELEQAATGAELEVSHNAFPHKQR